MTVKELIEKLQEFDGELEVEVSSPNKYTFYTEEIVYDDEHNCVLMVLL